MGGKIPEPPWNWLFFGLGNMVMEVCLFLWRRRWHDRVVMCAYIGTGANTPCLPSFSVLLAGNLLYVHPPPSPQGGGPLRGLSRKKTLSFSQTTSSSRRDLSSDRISWWLCIAQKMESTQGSQTSTFLNIYNSNLFMSLRKNGIILYIITPFNWP